MDTPVFDRDWAKTQRKKYGLRRFILRDILLQQVAFRVLVVPHVTGLDNIPEGGGTILMMNHTIAIDGVIILGVVKTRPVIPLLKIENFHDPFVGFLARHWGALGIQRGEVDRDMLRIVTDLLDAGEIVLIAPEGTRQPCLMRPKDGLAYLALKTNAIIVPTGISNGESWAYDMKRPWRRTHVDVVFGAPFRLKQENGRRVPRDVMHTMTEEMMYQLAALLPERCRGEYADLNKMSTQRLEFIK